MPASFDSSDDGRDEEEDGQDDVGDEFLNKIKMVVNIGTFISISKCLVIKSLSEGFILCKVTPLTFLSIT